MKNKPQLTVVKVGGAVAENPIALANMLDCFAAMAENKILVHGGGRSATALAKNLGLEVTMINGRRVTDSEMLKVVTMTYGGLVNKTIVSLLQERGVNSLGLTGADLAIITADRRDAMPVDYGYVGDVRSVNTSAIDHLIAGKIVPVIAPLSYDGHGGLLNTNADTIAASVATSMCHIYEVTLIYCFELPGVMRDPSDTNTLIKEITPDTYTRLKSEGVVSGGMIPKLDNAFESLTQGVSKVIITSSEAMACGAGSTIHL